MRHLLLLSGPLSIGKTVVARQLIDGHGFQAVRTGPYLAALAGRQGMPTDRTALQSLGDKLDTKTNFRWIVDQVAEPAFQANPATQLWLLDSVRKKRQVEHFRERYRDCVHHIHLAAPETLLRERYAARISAGGDYAGNVSYEAAVNHPNEVSSRSLVSIADRVIDVADKSPEEVAAIILKGLGERTNASGGTR